MFKSLLDQQVGNIFTILGQVDGLAPNQTYVQSDGQTYNTATQTYVTASTSYPDIPMTLVGFTQEERDAEVIVSTDYKALIPAIRMTVVPKLQDKIQLADGSVYYVHRNLGVPGGSLYILHVRRET